MLMIFAGWVFAGTLTTDMPAAQSMAEMMSESKPPHFPSARSGKICEFHVIPAMPTLLSVIAPRIPAVRVPCQELLATCALEHSELLRSDCVTQSPGSEASGPGQELLFATNASDMKQYPGSSRPPV